MSRASGRPRPELARGDYEALVAMGEARSREAVAALAAAARRSDQEGAGGGFRGPLDGRGAPARADAGESVREVES